MGKKPSLPIRRDKGLVPLRQEQNETDWNIMTDLGLSSKIFN